MFHIYISCWEETSNHCRDEYVCRGGSEDRGCTEYVGKRLRTGGWIEQAQDFHSGDSYLRLLTVKLHNVCDSSKVVIINKTRVFFLNLTKLF